MKGGGRQRSWLVAFLLAVLLVGGVTGYFILPTRVRYFVSWSASVDIIRRVDEFRRRFGRLPDREEMGVSEVSRTFYEPKGDFYQVGFHIGFDDYCVFDSRASHWDCTK
jgi:hypothetical protein